MDAPKSSRTKYERPASPNPGAIPVVELGRGVHTDAANTGIGVADIEALGPNRLAARKSLMSSSFVLYAMFTVVIAHMQNKLLIICVFT
jgi:hypothetical protein